VWIVDVMQAWSFSILVGGHIGRRTYGVKGVIPLEKVKKGGGEGGGDGGEKGGNKELRWREGWWLRGDRGGGGR